jgi:hypothetical protein
MQGRASLDVEYFNNTPHYSTAKAAEVLEVCKWTIRQNLCPDIVNGNWFYYKESTILDIKKDLEDYKLFLIEVELFIDWFCDKYSFSLLHKKMKLAKWQIGRNHLKSPHNNLLTESSAIKAVVHLRQYLKEYDDWKCKFN